MEKNEVNVDHSDHDRERYTKEKRAQFIRVLFSKRATRTLAKVWKFWNIDFEKLWNLWKRWMILDIDECVAPHHWRILPENLEKIKQLKEKWWKIIVFSNMKKSDRYEELELLWIEVLASEHPKPDTRWFEECLEILNLSSEQTIMVWDNFLTDWWALNVWEEWIDFVKVNPIKSKLEIKLPRNKKDAKKILHRAWQVVSRKIANIISDIRHWK